MPKKFYEIDPWTELKIKHFEEDTRLFFLLLFIPILAE